MLDSKGNLIGINTAIFTQTGKETLSNFLSFIHFLNLKILFSSLKCRKLGLCLVFVAYTRKNLTLVSSEKHRRALFCLTFIAYFLHVQPLET